MDMISLLLGVLAALVLIFALFVMPALKFEDRGALRAYVFVFISFMFAPLILMMLAAFNQASPPSVMNWEGFTFQHFVDLAMDREYRTLRQCLGNSFILTGIVTPMAVLMGLSAALILRVTASRIGGALYPILVTPMLTPGIVLGISTIILWREVGVEGGLFTATLAQLSFIASYPMLIIMARLQRHDGALDDAAMDLGASPFFAFRKILLPFLVPALATSAVIAFLMSFENYNTTVFSIGGSCTLTTQIVQEARRVHTPVINALGVIFVGLTILISIIYTYRFRQRNK